MKFLSLIPLCFLLCLCVHRNLKGDSNSRGTDNIDEWGRLHPDPERWPSSKGWKGFKNVADKVHDMDLKFGIHLMAGISTQAYDSNTPILDTKTGKAYEESGKVWHAKDIGVPGRACKWMSNGFMALNVTSGAGKAFLRSLYELYISWGLDFVKLDCVFGEDIDFEEITYVSQILKELKPSIVFSLSPGVSATPNMAKVVNGLVNMYRVTGDDWDQWSQVVTHFDVARDYAAAKLIGAQGLNGNSWPDLDMLPFGWLTDPGQDIYIAFFNLNDKATTISWKFDDLVKALPGKKLVKGLDGREVWSLNRVVLNDVLSAEVAAHGCALFVFDY
ncbi:unnamed protein product [Lupinus luteus]|uniref:alpha-galactosidase n=1 Tax=Lupinus luteus TaxID=3873 RepID=A0AAV1WED9_LUPLU